MGWFGGVEYVRRAGILRPALQEFLVRGARLAGAAGALQRSDRAEPARFVRGGRNSVGRHDDHRPVAAAPPQELVHVERQRLALLLARAQDEIAGVVVVADRNRIVPAAYG